MNSCSSNFSETHLENDVKDVAVALEELLDVPVPAVARDVADENSLLEKKM